MGVEPMQEVMEFTAALHLAAKALQFYTADHPRGVEALTRLEQTANALLARRPRVSIAAAKGALLVDGAPLGAETSSNKAHAAALARELEARQFSGIVLLQGVTYRELAELVRLFVMKPPQLREAGGAEEVFRRAEVKHVRISNVRYEAISEDEEVVSSKTARLAGELAGDLAGVAPETLHEALDLIGWDKLSSTEKIDTLLADNRLFETPREKVVAFIRQLLEQRRHDEVLRLLDAYAHGLEQNAVGARENVIDTFAAVASMIETPGVSPPIEQLLTRVILNHFVKESDARMHATVANAVASLCTALVATARADVALRTLSRLESAVAVADRNAAVRQSYELLGRAFAAPAHAEKIIAQLYGADPETLAKSVIPLVAHLADALVPVLLETLANEEDRNRRGRLVRALKAIGKPAHPFLLDALQSPTWYVVRNTLNILGDIGEHDHAAAIAKDLQHGDARVRRAAARALGKIGGAESEALLVAAIHDADPEMLSEMLPAFGSMKSERAVAPLSELAKTRSLAADVRESVIATLGQIGSAAAVPALVDLVRPRALFTREALTIRVAAARALAAIATPDALAALQNTINAETDRAAKTAFAGILQP